MTAERLATVEHAFRNANSLRVASIRPTRTLAVAVSPGQTERSDAVEVALPLKKGRHAHTHAVWTPVQPKASSSEMRLQLSMSRPAPP